MAQMSYEEFMKFNQKPEKQKGESKNYKPRVFVRYFGLAEDGDTGIVRFNVQTLDDIKIVSKHRLKTATGKIRNIACLRTSPDQSLDVCPLCAAGEKVSFRAYVPLISYEQDEQGNTVPVPCLWEQAPRIREILKSFTATVSSRLWIKVVFNKLYFSKDGRYFNTFIFCPPKSITVYLSSSFCIGNFISE